MNCKYATFHSNEQWQLIARKKQPKVVTGKNMEGFADEL